MAHSGEQHQELDNNCFRFHLGVKTLIYIYLSILDMRIVLDAAFLSLNTNLNI